MGFGLTCPKCGHSYLVPGDFRDMTFQGNEMNVVAPCPACGHVWDATGGGDGTWSGIGGRLVRVASAVAEMDRDQVESLLALLKRAQKSKDSDKAAEALDALDVEAPKTGWQGQGNRMELWAIATLVVAVLALVLPLFDRGESVSPEQIERLIRAAQHDRAAPPAAPAAPERIEREVGRNELCPCGSGAKFKRCHGQHVPPGTNASR
jgi:hypothetical protein